MVAIDLVTAEESLLTIAPTAKVTIALAGKSLAALASAAEVVPALSGKSLATLAPTTKIIFPPNALALLSRKGVSAQTQEAMATFLLHSVTPTPVGWGRGDSCASLLAYVPSEVFRRLADACIFIKSG